MVDVEFEKRVPNPITLSTVKALAAGGIQLDYLPAKGLEAIKKMHLINRGRLSKSNLCTTDTGVQPVEQEAYDALILMGERGGWNVPEKAAKTGDKRAIDQVEPEKDGREVRRSRRHAK